MLGIGSVVERFGKGGISVKMGCKTPARSPTILWWTLNLLKINFGTLVCKTTFSEAAGVTFLCDAVVTWKEYVRTEDELFGGRKYEHVIYKEVEGSVKDFLLAFQRLCVKMKTHKF